VTTIATMVTALSTTKASRAQRPSGAAALTVGRHRRVVEGGGLL
jgi:hypothetical protein